MSPLQLASLAPATAPDELHLNEVVATVTATASGELVIDGPVIGLVDELDDPGPGHMSERPTALTAVTSIAPETTENANSAASGENAEAQKPKPMFGGSLEERFVKAEKATSGDQEGDAPMAVEEPDEDKENVPKP